MLAEVLEPETSCGSFLSPAWAMTVAGNHSMKPIKHLRWWIVWTLFGSTVINYVSRMTISLLSQIIIPEFHLTYAQYGAIGSFFSYAYAVTWLVGGIILDRVGPRIGLTVAVIWWSVVNIVTSAASSLLALQILRSLFGVGEGFNWPGANKVVAEWFPARERGLAVGIFDSGSSVGGLIAGPLVTFVALRFGWRATFVVTGAMGFFWLIPWLYFYRPLTSHPRLSLDERRLIESGRDTALRSSRQGLDKYLGLLRQSNVWGIVLGRTLTDPIWWFYITWMPQYFGEVRGFNLKQIGFFLPSIFIASDLGNLMGGWVSGRLINRGMPVLAARKWVCVFSAVPMLAVIPGAMTSRS